MNDMSTLHSDARRNPQSLPRGEETADKLDRKYLKNRELYIYGI